MRRGLDLALIAASSMVGLAGRHIVVIDRGGAAPIVPEPLMLSRDEHTRAVEKLPIARLAADEARRQERLPRARNVDPPPQNGAREVARRLRRIQAGQLKAENGLAR